MRKCMPIKKSKQNSASNDKKVSNKKKTTHPTKPKKNLDRKFSFKAKTQKEKPVNLKVNQTAQMKVDPNLIEEAEKYEHPVPSRDFIINYLETINQPQSLKQLIAAFELQSDQEHEGLRRRLIAMSRDGQLISNRRQQYALVAKMKLVRGCVQGHKDGFGFVIAEDGGSDIFIPAREMRKVFTDDVVLVRVDAAKKRRREGTIIEVLERNTSEVVGRYIVEGGVAFVVPDSKTITQDIMLIPEESVKAEPGQYVVVEITVQPGIRNAPIGKIIQILGDVLAPNMEVELALRSHEIPFVWPPEVLAETDHMPDAVDFNSAKEREDLRALPFVTIDGADSKDFDDAVYCVQEKNGYTLFVAIADVSHYVQPKTALDIEAERRANSVYFPNQVVPMLPEKISNHLCSLVPQQDRFVMVCEMQLNKQGQLLESEFYNAVIHSQARLTYDTVADALVLKSHQEPYWQSVFTLHHLFEKLFKQRSKRGALEFDTVETKIIFDKDGKIAEIKPTERNDAHRMIEESMLLANVAAATALVDADMPTLYRNHEKPEATRLQTLRDFIEPFGLKLMGGENPSTLEFSKLLNRVKEKKEAKLIETVILRSQRQAVYSPEVLGHFGLAYNAYLHFTSPIRRYPDLLVHRALKHLIAGKKPRSFIYRKQDMVVLGQHCSMAERRADRASRDALDWLKCYFMQDKIGQEFEGRISDVTSFGVFVQLDKFYVDGLVHVTSLQNDYYTYDNAKHLLRGERAGKIYRLGDRVKVLVGRVDLNERFIDFEMV